MSFRRLLFMFVLALAAAIVVVPGASAGNFDEERMGCAGEDPAICKAGTQHQPYSLKLYLLGDEDLGCAVFSVSSGNLPPGLTIAPTDGVISGTPTQAGNFDVYLTVTYNREIGCEKPASDDRFVIPINPGTAPPPPPPSLPRLIIGPEFVSPATVGTPYRAAMTANLPDAKTWSIVAGALPAGVTLGPSDGVITGRPAASGSYAFTVRAQIADGRSDTKSLTLDVRNRLTLTPTGDLALRTVRTEVGVEFHGAVFAAGGFGTYTWSVEGDLPPGLTLGEDGTITGAPEESGSYRFTMVVTDAERRRATYVARFVVAERLTIKSRLLKPARVGFFMSRKVTTLGGVAPMRTKVKRGPLPPGIFFDRLAGVFVGTPTKAGTWKIRVEIVDALGVKTTGVVLLVVRA